MSRQTKFRKAKSTYLPGDLGLGCSALAVSLPSAYGAVRVRPVSAGQLVLAAVRSQHKAGADQVGSKHLQTCSRSNDADLALRFNSPVGGDARVSFSGQDL